MKKRNIYILIGIIILALIIGGFLIGLLGFQQEAVFTRWRETESECIERKARWLEDHSDVLDEWQCSDCFVIWSQQIDCLIDNCNKYNTEYCELDSEDRSEIVDEGNAWFFYCGHNSDFNPLAPGFDEDAWILRECIEDSTYDFGVFCDTHADCQGMQCDGINRIDTECVNYECIEQPGEIRVGYCGVECLPTDDYCDGLIWFTCNPSTYNWESQGINTEECGECVEGTKEYYECFTSFVQDNWIKKECISGLWDYPEYYTTPGIYPCTCADNSVCRDGFICESGECEIDTGGNGDENVIISMPMNIYDILGTMDVEFDIDWTGGVSPYIIQIELGDGNVIYIEDIIGTGYITQYTYSLVGEYDGSVCVYDSEPLTLNDCKSFTIQVSGNGYDDVEILTPMSINHITGTMDVEFDIDWTGGKSPYTFEVAIDGITSAIIRTEGITSTEFTAQHTFSSTGTYDGDICVYDSDGLTLNDCKSFSINVVESPLEPINWKLYLLIGIIILAVIVITLIIIIRRKQNGQ